MPPQHFYLNWQFWSALVAITAVALSQLPPVHLWFRPRRVEVEVHSRIRIAHKVGNPNVGMFVSVRNTGGRELRVRGLNVSLTRDGNFIGIYPALNYFENPSSQSPVLFVPFTIKPGETWAHSMSFLNLFDRANEKLYRESESKLSADIRGKLASRPGNDKQAVVADPELVAPFINLFEQLFIWKPGEYVAELVVDVEPGSATFKQSYRFTLYESDTTELRDHTQDYKFGGGLSYNVDKHIGVFVPISRHVG